ncbi:xylan glycosyltransferase MUCI21-like [Magnolia sinica]|uniref:xylan glycosyltransferase MUCI21-like n=1 Tax=Magnolia sinica TaxID=86752 RepID=UPI00265AE3B3|nr:xylan glycosyltransferase MUCI21-like [Magnolia sinica]
MERRASAPLIVCLLFLAIYSFHHISLSPMIKETDILWVPSLTKSPISCDRSNFHYDFCSLNGPTVMVPKTSTLLVVGSTIPIQSTIQKVRPYPRKWEKNIMAHIKEITIVTASSTASIKTACRVYHNAPALVFSNGGYTGNLFHDFNDGLIPLFITSRLITSDGRYPVLVIANCHNWWLSKYADLLRGLTPHPIINLDRENDIHCFPSATVGLVSHGFASINPSLMPNSESLLDFRTFLDYSYMATGGTHLPLSSMKTHPRLLLVSREGTVGRVILNQEDLVRTAENVGFEVTIFKPTRFTNLREAYHLINASHVMLGVHGAALTHSYFLQPGAVLIQVVPLGLEWASRVCFGGPAKQLGLEYMEYKIRVDESSLSDKYGKDDVVLRNPRAVVKKGWSYTDSIYLKKQDVRLDLNRVRSFLEAAYQNATGLMKKGF